MISFFQHSTRHTLAVQSDGRLSASDIKALTWLFEGAAYTEAAALEGYFIGPRKEMITPWSTTAVEITQNMRIQGIGRIEEFFPATAESTFDPMLQVRYNGLDQNIFTVDKKPAPIVYIDDLEAYNVSEGLALSAEEIDYLLRLEKKMGRKLTDSEIFGFSQVNSEHCRHKIFNGTFVIDGKTMPSTLFKLIKKTSEVNPNRILSAYKDNCAFIEGPDALLFHPQSGDKPDYFTLDSEKIVISLKAETHNFPTTVEPFNGAATGSGGEIRDRAAGGNGSFPMAGTAAYFTSYPRFEGEADRTWEHTPPRPWLYQTPQEILIKASNGASDFGNKFGQPLICGSLLTYEHTENGQTYGYDKVVMLAGGVGYAKRKDCLKGHPAAGDKVVLMGGDNYRIGMGGGAVSSVDTGEYANAIELNAVQRSNPEMQKRVVNAIRTLAEAPQNPIVSIHDHGAGGHLNCLSELVEETGGNIDINKLPIGDPTLSAKEIIGNESQERMGMVVHAEDIPMVQRIAERERAPMYVIGDITDDHRFTFSDSKTGKAPIDLAIEDFLGGTPKTVMTDTNTQALYEGIYYQASRLQDYIEKVLQTEAVACKDWLTNKVDRSVTGLIAQQQCAGELQLPLNNAGIVATDYQGKRGIATSMGHAPAVALIDPAAGSRIAIAEALTNLVWVPIQDKIAGVSLSANWMWPCRSEAGEDARLYKAVQAASDFCIALGINIPTGKDSLSMTQKYPSGEKVIAPGSVIISTVGEVTDIRKTVRPVLKKDTETTLLYVNISQTPYGLGGSAFAQVMGKAGSYVPDIADPQYFVRAFNTVQTLLQSNLILAGHDVSAGGLITTLLEMCFANTDFGLEIDLSALNETDIVKLLFSESPALVMQVRTREAVAIRELFSRNGINAQIIGAPIAKRTLRIYNQGEKYKFDIDALRDKWYRTSYLFDRIQSGEKQAAERFHNYKLQPLRFTFPAHFDGMLATYGLDKKRILPTGIRAAIIREKGSNGDREMAWIMYLAGFDVKDVHMTDLVSGRETLDDVNLIVFVGGFSNADVLGSAKGWAGAFLYNEKARQALDRFYAREDTLSLGVCNGCQLMAELGLIRSDSGAEFRMRHNDSHKLESNFVNVQVEFSNAIMLRSLAGSRLGIWITHGEGKFALQDDIEKYHVALRYSYNAYPANPNGSPDGIAGICSTDGRHLAMMPHPERGTYPWNWACYPEDRQQDEVTPWIEMFVEARKWIEKQ
ncbi:MAG: phosphoribosylformylglycinamidine synthase [Bacteroidales bacterium]|nr:phosphoribosylformylglycinamidine synthase [Bacteroidales bacterium]